MENDAERLELRLLVGAAGSAPAPFELDAPTDATVGATAEAFAHSLGVGNGEVFLERTGSWLPRGGPLAEIGLRHGDRLLLAAERDAREPEQRAAEASLELAVVGGPSS